MKGDKIPGQNNVARFCRPWQAPDGHVEATAFMVRPDESSLSVNWLEFLKCSNREKEIAELRKIYSLKFTVGSRARIAILNVGEVCEKVLKESPDGRNLEILHDPEFTEKYSDQSHSGIYNLRYDDELIAELLLETVREAHPARQ